MPRTNSTVKIVDGKVVFSQEIIDYFENIETKENSEWIKKYFETLGDENNVFSEKYRNHHIIPCFMFKDETHKTRKEALPLANNIEGNLIKLSVRNHILAHYYLWKIFNNEDSRRAIYLMCIKRNLNCLSESEIKEFAKIQEECANKNQTEAEILEKKKKEYKENKEIFQKRNKNYYIKNKDKLSKYQKEYRQENKEEISKRRKKRYQENRDEELRKKKIYNEENRDEILKNKKEYYEKIKNRITERNSQRCKDPLEGDECSYCALQSRKKRDKERYKNIKLSDCIIQPQPQS